MLDSRTVYITTSRLWLWNHSARSRKTWNLSLKSQTNPDYLSYYHVHPCSPSYILRYRHVFTMVPPPFLSGYEYLVLVIPQWIRTTSRCITALSALYTHTDTYSIYIYICVYHYIILYYHFSVWNPYLGPIVPQLFVVKPSNTQGPPAVRGATAWQDLGSMVAECWMVGEWLKKYVWKNKYIESMDWIGLPGERKNGCCLKHVETIEFSTSNGRFNRMAHKFCRTTIIQNLPFSFAG